MRRRCLELTVLLMCAAMLYNSAASAANIETLLMPGKVAAAHAKLEGECANCHDRSNRTSQPTLCLSCHKEVAADVRTHNGFHGRMPQAGTAQCNACHTEHKGREADIVKFVPAAFDHALTDFPLRDAHAAAPCAGCHQAKKKYREAPAACVDCHKKADAHAGRLGADCAACHNSASWMAARFDHGQTKFALTNRHQRLQCAACHFGNRYQGTPRQCVSCHAPDDIHQGARGAACEQCHSTASWTTAKFDHAKETGFALLGAHARADCASCHAGGRLQDPVPRDCNGCHRGQDSHAGRMGGNCERCHDSLAWKPARFDHARDTKFILSGAHAKLDCHACHTANVAEQKLDTACNACHRAQDVHGGKLGAQCEQCHDNKDWRAEVRFDHDLTDFPLLGLHVAVPCEQCHLTRQYKDVAGDCHACHEDKDRHKGSLGKNCAQCHSPNGWNLWDFDHDKSTPFALSGAHAKAECNDCHRLPAAEVKLSGECASCHVRDDVHFGQFGRQCQRCHVTTSFKQVRMR